MTLRFCLFDTKGNVALTFRLLDFFMGANIKVTHDDGLFHFPSTKLFHVERTKFYCDRRRAYDYFFF